METKQVAQDTATPAQRPYDPPRLTRYQRLQEMTRGDSATGNVGAVEDCVIPGHCESNPIT